MRNLPPLAAIRAFEAAARHENYTRAGEELGMTQAAVSYQIKNLEARVGTPLFLRNGRKMELTPAGAQLAPHIAQAFSVMDGAFADLGSDESAVLSIACFETFAAKLLAPRLGTFQIAHPEIAVRLCVSDAFVDLASGECDIAIRLSRDVPATLEHHDLMPLEIAPFASAAFIAEHPDLQGAKPIIAEARRISPGSIWWQAWDAAREYVAADGAGEPTTSRRGLLFDSQMLDSAAAISGNGVAILSPQMFGADIQSGQLQRVGKETARPGPAYRLIYPAVRRHSGKVRAFRAWLSEEFGPIFAGTAPRE